MCCYFSFRPTNWSYASYTKLQMVRSWLSRLYAAFFLKTKAILIKRRESPFYHPSHHTRNDTNAILSSCQMLCRRTEAQIIWRQANLSRHHKVHNLSFVILSWTNMKLKRHAQNLLVLFCHNVYISAEPNQIIFGLTLVSPSSRPLASFQCLIINIVLVNCHKVKFFSKYHHQRHGTY
jgi:hypothetical protein